MSTDLSFIEYLHEQTDLGDALTHRKMFGEYALYYWGKVFAFVCDNHVYLKPTSQARALLHTVSEHPPYPGGKPHYRLGDEIDDRALLQRLFRATAEGLPAQPPKKARAKKS